MTQIYFHLGIINCKWGVNFMKRKKLKFTFMLTVIVGILITSICAYALSPNGVSVSSATVYSTASGSTSIGSIGVNENVAINSTSGTRSYITYRTTGADKSGWVSSSAVKSAAWQWPVDCMTMTHDFNQVSSQGRGYHFGIDMISNIGDKSIRAAYGGKVIYAGYASGNGNHIIIEHTIGTRKLYSLYSHLSSIASGITANTTVTRGTYLGVMGNTGLGYSDTTTGVHLHFQIYDNNYATNPFGWTASAEASGATVSRYTNKMVMNYNGTIIHYDPEYIIRNNGAIPIN